MKAQVKGKGIEKMYYGRREGVRAEESNGGKMGQM